MKLVPLVVLSGLMLGATVACAAGNEALSRGKGLYFQYCSACHGRVGLSNTPLGKVLEPPPRKLADPVAMARIDDERVFKVIKDGKPGTAMPGWGRLLNDRQIREVAAYVRSLKRPRPAWMSQDDFDVAVGGEVYQSYCAICHGSMGNAQTRIGKVLETKPRNFTDAQRMRRLSNEEMARAIAFGKPGTAMVAWRSLLSPGDIRRVVMYIRHQFTPGK
jgi:mono/diheme cytochrome c family protein